MNRARTMCLAACLMLTAWAASFADVPSTEPSPPAAPAPLAFPGRPGHFRPATIPAFNPADLTDPNDIVRLKAVYLLRQDDPKLRAYDKVLATLATDDSDTTVRGAAAAMLAEVYARAAGDAVPDGATLTQDAVIKVLIAAMNDPDIRVAAGAARAAGDFGTRGAAALPKLTAMLDDDKFGAVANVLAQTMRLLDPTAKALVAELSGTAPVRTKAAVIQGFSQERTHEHAPLIATFLTSAEPDLRLAAINALTSMRVRDRDIVNQISGMASDADQRIRAAVVRSMMVMGTRDELVAVTQQLASDNAPLVRSAVAAAQRRLQPGRRPAATRPA